MSYAIGNWRCFFWHVWRWDRRDLAIDLCIRPGCGEIRAHQPGTRLSGDRDAQEKAKEA